MRRLVLVVATLLMLGPTAAFAEYGRTPVSTIDPSMIRIDEQKHLGSPIDKGYVLLDEAGSEFKMGEFFGKPTILVLSYFRCDGACPIANAELRKKLDAAKGMERGKDYNVLTLSFDRDDRPEAIGMFKGMAGTSIDGWRTAVFKDEKDITALTSAVGFKFFWSMRDKTFIHPNVYIVLTPEGRVARYLYGAVAGSTDIRAAIAEANFGNPANSKAEDISDLMLIACYSYNYQKGKYVLNYPLFIAGGSLLSAISLTVVGLLVYKRKAGR
jgi:protein SCO1/2